MIRLITISSAAPAISRPVPMFHRVNEMIFVYEQAVLLHNKALHPTYQAEHERRLREFVEGECLRAARMKIVAQRQGRIARRM